MTLLVRHPRGSDAERCYIYDVVLREFLGLSVEAIAEERTDVRIEILGDTKRHLILTDIFMQLPWLDESSLPQLPLLTWTLPKELNTSQRVEARLPILYGEPVYSPGDGHIQLGLDIFGSCFFMLSRYEEVIRRPMDRHGRFPSTASIAGQANFIDRPIVNEYVELLWSCLTHLWPNLRRTIRTFRMVITCDVDNPVTCWARRSKSTARKIAKAILREHSPRSSLSAFMLHLQHRRKRYDLDPNMTFDWMMKECETAATAATFYFICDHSSHTYDGCYRIDEPFIRRLLKRIHDAGHHLGVHGSYNSYLNGVQLAKEVSLIKQILSEEHIDQDITDSRQHYLRWRTPDTAGSIMQAGLTRDSTLGFAEQAGFRCGTCYEYPLYDVGTRRTLPLRERPLIAMEQSVISPLYMNLGHSDNAILSILELKRKCKSFGGDFVLLWHNSSLTTAREREMYRAVLRE